MIFIRKNDIDDIYSEKIIFIDNDIYSEKIIIYKITG